MKRSMPRSCRADQVKYDDDLRPSPIVPTRFFYLTVTALWVIRASPLQLEDSRREG
ncbi:MAG: hypothetical protein ACI92S_005014 [Planctomycetaceae bacterium]|jgi:hypothetical protein